jgi:hypothetical protein
MSDQSISVPQGAYTPEQLAKLDAEAGWPYQDIPKAVAVEEEETHGIPGETDPIVVGGDEQAYGLFQELEPNTDKQIDTKMLDDPLYDAEAAKGLFGEQGWGAWIPDTEAGYVGGKYRTPDQVAKSRGFISYKHLLAATSEATKKAIPSEAAYQQLATKGAKVPEPETPLGPQAQATLTGYYTSAGGPTTAPGWLTTLDAMMNPAPSGGSGIVGAIDEVLGLVSGSTEMQIVALTFSRGIFGLLSLGSIGLGIYLMFGMNAASIAASMLSATFKTPTSLKVTQAAGEHARQRSAEVASREERRMAERRSLQRERDAAAERRIAAIANRERLARAGKARAATKATKRGQEVKTVQVIRH